MRLVLAAAVAIAVAGCGRGEADNVISNEGGGNVALSEIDAPRGPDVAATTDDSGIARAIAAKLADDGGVSDNARWFVARTDLNGDSSDEALVYLVDPMMCGTGGCSLYVLADGGNGSWTVTDTIGPSQLPVYKLASATGGWADLGVAIRGGGAGNALMKVAHSGSNYASNPTVAPATETTPSGATLLIADDYDKAVPVPR
ncbi:hypothetical protein [Sphingomonas sabuli]|uniref:hypothetical protein n=1 Tax=Sphingomonas sabuli TaxID=2764186 RepID=UPI001FE53229|nr:hypothetical protein [Sphingomonas sabuli]